ncbi:MAG: SRPBCC family protein [Chloroflexota bacterium]|nr:SRPBCC family protein [Chloroflexota bacterium]
MQQRASDVHAEAERRINAPSDLVYRLIADYNTHHPAFLPPAFSNLTVEQGSSGDGTVIGFDLKLGGRKRRMRARISEPRPGVLQETDLEFGAVTTFEVIQDANASRVLVRTEFASAPGFLGWIERRFAPGMLRRLYQQELANLDTYARQQAATTIATTEAAALAH